MIPYNPQHPSSQASDLENFLCLVFLPPDLSKESHICKLEQQAFAPQGDPAQRARLQSPKALKELTEVNFSFP